MASKTVFFVLACFLMINTKVSSTWEDEIFSEGSTVASAPAPSTVYKSSPPPPPPPPSPIVKAPPPPPMAPPTPPPVQRPRNRKECIPLCVVRCKNHSRKNICARACLTCCERCKCVPPGQYGNKEKCGKCYSEMTTHGGMLKCP